MIAADFPAALPTQPQLARAQQRPKDLAERARAARELQGEPLVRVLEVDVEAGPTPRVLDHPQHEHTKALRAAVPELPAPTVGVRPRPSPASQA